MWPYFQSRWTAIRGALGHRRYLLGGLVAAVLAIYETATQKFEWLPEFPGWQLAVLVVLLTIILAAVRKIVDLAEQLEPRLEITGPYRYQVMSSNRTETFALRFGLRNSSATTVCQAAAFARISTLNGQMLWPIDLPLERETGGFGRSDIDPGQEERFKSVSLRLMGRDSPTIYVHHNVRGYSQNMQVGDYLIEIKAFGRDVIPATKAIEITCEGEKIHWQDRKTGG